MLAALSYGRGSDPPPPLRRLTLIHTLITNRGLLRLVTPAPLMPEPALPPNADALTSFDEFQAVEVAAARVEVAAVLAAVTPLQFGGIAVTLLYLNAKRCSKVVWLCVGA